MLFDINLFLGYKICNVDCDKYVKDISGIIYVFSEKIDNNIIIKLILFVYLGDKYCVLCCVGFYMV